MVALHDTNKKQRLCRINELLFEVVCILVHSNQFDAEMNVKHVSVKIMALGVCSFKKLGRPTEHTHLARLFDTTSAHFAPQNTSTGEITLSACICLLKFVFLDIIFYFEKIMNENCSHS